KKCDKVFLESYTSILVSEKHMSSLVEDVIQRDDVISADRDMVETDSDQILDAAETGDSALLVIGDPFCATTHSDMYLRARERGIEVQVFHNASIMSAVGGSGLEVYRFGYCVSIVFWNWENSVSSRPTSFYTRILDNKARGLHTLCLLDIKVKERSDESYMHGTNEFLPPRYMTSFQAAEEIAACPTSMHTQAFEAAQYEDSDVEEDAIESPEDIGSSLAVACCRVGTTGERFYVGTLAELGKLGYGERMKNEEEEMEGIE
ncbi:diphthine synthase, partial [Kipferlia bialata]